MQSPTPFEIKVPDAVLDRIQTQVAKYPWHYMPDDGGWEYGTNLDYLQGLCRYWVEDYDWRAQEARLNSFDHFKMPVDGLDVHYIHEKGSGPAPTPLIISHGWPGSVVEFLNIIEPLAHPERFGGDPADAFDVIAPSLPGFGFSERPPRPWGPRKMAGSLAKLMQGLGYDGYIAQGGDWGGAMSTWLGFDHAPACKGIHVNIMIMRHVDGSQTEDEKAWAKRFLQEQVMQEGYRTQQATKPQTLSFAMNDNPVGVAAWIIEKFRGWSDIRDRNFEKVHSRDDLLTNVMIYLVTGTFNSASWIYYGRREEGGRMMDPEGRRVEVPTACAVFPEELLSWPPRSYVDRLYNVTQWSEFDQGGHFAAMERPDDLVDDIRKFARSLRGG